MSKLTLNDLANLQNETSAVALINRNSALIETALDNTLSRDGSTPNQMTSDLDMNGNAVLNSAFELAQDFQFSGDFRIANGRSLIFADGSSMSSAGVSNTSSNVVITRGALATNYTPLSPGGSIVIGSNTVTLTPVPSGLNGTDTNHYVYLSGGVGTAEAVLITGGTAVSGGVSGTITFTAAHTHTGAWTIKSATQGIDEMLRLSTKPTVIIPEGDFDIYASITPPDGSTIKGVGVCNDLNTTQSSRLKFYGTNTPLFNLIHTEITIENLSLENVSGAAVAGGVGIFTNSGCINFTLRNLTIWRFYNGINTGDSSWALLNNIHVFLSTSHGIRARGSQGPWDILDSESNVGDGLHIEPGDTGNTSVPFIRGFHTFNNGGWGLNSTLGFVINEFYINFDYAGGVFLNTATGAGAGSQKPAVLHNGSIEVAGGSISFGTNTTAPGVKVASTSGQPLFITGALINTNQGNNVEFDCPNNMLADSYLASPGQGGVAGFLYSILSGAGSNLITNNRILNPVKLTGGSDTFVGNQITFAHATIPSLEFGAGTFSNFCEQNIVNNPTGGGIAIKLSVSCTVKAPFSNTIVAGSTTSAATNFAGQLTTSTAKITGAGFGSSTHTAASSAGNGTITWPVTDIDFSAMGGAYPVSGKAAGVVVKGNRQPLGGSNPTVIATGMTSITSAVVTLEGTGAPGVGTSVLTIGFSGGTLNVYAWKPTSSSNPTLIASTGTENFGWFVTGT